jgi:hypothetical protein
MANLELAEKVKAYLREQPLRLGMGDWITRYEGAQEYAPPCNTVCCVAGATLIVAGIVRDAADYAARAGKDYIHAADKARELLGISENDADKLFYVQHWPKNQNREYYAAVDTYYRDIPQLQKERVELTCQVIDYVIAHPEPDVPPVIRALRLFLGVK